MRGKKNQKRKLPNGKIRTSIIIPQPIHRLGKDRAKSQHRSFSSHVTTLVEADAAAEVGK